MAFFSFKNPLNDKLLDSGCTRAYQSSGLTQGSVLEFFPSLTYKICAMQSKDIKLEEGYLY